MNHWKDTRLDKTQYRPKYPDSLFIHIADLVNQETNKTYREENAEKAHAISIGTLVEINYEDGEENGTRLFVVYNGRDCDMTPLYGLAADPSNTEQKQPGRANPKWHTGYSEDCLTVIRRPEENRKRRKENEQP